MCDIWLSMYAPIIPNISCSPSQHCEVIKSLNVFHNHRAICRCILHVPITQLFGIPPSWVLHFNFFRFSVTRSKYRNIKTWKLMIKDAINPEGSLPTIYSAQEETLWTVPELRQSFTPIHMEYVKIIPQLWDPAPTTHRDSCCHSLLKIIQNTLIR